MAGFRLPFTVGSQILQISSSIGISISPDDGKSRDALLKNADIAMYHAKETGINNYQFFNTDMNIKAVRLVILENSLRQTLQK